MPLTDSEKALVTTATYFGQETGDITQGWSPEGLLALSRGARPMLIIQEDRAFFTFLQWHKVGVLAGGEDADIWQQAMYDIMAWLGYETIHEYTQAMKKYGPGIFQRVAA